MSMESFLKVRKMGKELLERLKKVIIKSGIKLLHLVVNNNHKKLWIRENLVKNLPKELTIKSRKEIGGYLIYQIEYNSE